MEKTDRAGNTAIWVTAALCIAFAMSFATDFPVANASPLQDFCVGVDDPKSAAFTNGKFCKDPKYVTINDFLYKGFNIPGDTNNTQGANATLVDINLCPAVNTLGVSIARVDFGPFGLNTPHFHPLGSEMFAVLEGTLYAGFVTTKNKLYDTIVKKGDVIVFPQGLIHFQLNLGETNAVAIASFGSQNPGRVNVANSIFGSTPPIFDDVLTKAFQVNENAIEQFRAQYSKDNVTDAKRTVLRLLSQFTS
ncbi:putative germin-like protein 2-1 [Beta vulgaris subsp. vulgaris]|uniref:putative germin-like protein 2-1 n=1 Tax=Beta vulgaris subsp. vulgaris TaxID=3555 RepID=UPI00203669FE|nr:putative germin-like protein 2-1 [Beta vulgaris subsp. vulgaris]